MKYMNYCENYVFVGKLSNSLVLFKVGTCHFTIIEMNITVIFREHFSS